MLTLRFPFRVIVFEVAGPSPQKIVALDIQAIRSVAIAWLVAKAMHRFGLPATFQHLSFSQWGRDSCGKGNGCADCEERDHDKAEFVHEVFCMIRDELL